MRPLILEYTEKPKNVNFDFSKIEYSQLLNLTVDKATGLPAIDYLNLSTETHTRTYDEASDSDADMNIMMGTLTKTSYQIEATDDDASFITVKSMIDTTTITLVNQEVSESDR